MKRTLKMLLFSCTISLSAMAQISPLLNVDIIELNDNSFKQKVWNFDKETTFKRIGNLPIILDFHATWCRPCKMLAPHLQTIQNKYNGKLIIYKIDVDKSPEIARKFNVKAMPTIVFINSTTNYEIEMGYREYAEFERLVKTHFFTK
jgi:thioredoxin